MLGRGTGSPYHAALRSATSALIEGSRNRLARGARKGSSIQLDAVKVLSPVTAPCRIDCNGADHRQHMISPETNADAAVAIPQGKDYRGFCPKRPLPGRRHRATGVHERSPFRFG